MAGGPLGSPDNPAYLDPFTEIVAFSGLGSQFITFALNIIRSPTIDYQRGRFDLMGVDSGPVDEITGENVATQCRYVWSSRRILRRNWNGTIWTEIADQDKEPIIPAFHGRSGGDWKTLDSKKAPTVSGLPTLPQTIPLAGVVGQVGRGDFFAPQARWDDLEITGSNTFGDFMAPGGTGNYARVGSVTIRMIGLAPSGGNPSIVGVVPEGGFVSVSGNYPVVQQPLTINLGGITVTDGKNKKKQWKAFAASKRQGSPSTLGTKVPPDPGAMMILCARTTDKKIFPRG